MDVLEKDAIVRKLESVHDAIKKKKYTYAEKVLKEILQLEKEQVDPKTLFAEAKMISTHLNQKRRSRKLFLVSAIILVSIVAMVAFLGWGKVNSTEIELNLFVDAFSFELEKEWSIYSLDIEAIGISNLNNLNLEIQSLEKAIEYDPATDSPITWQKVNANEPFYIERTENNWGVTIKGESLLLSSMYIDSGSTITIATNEKVKDQLLMRISGGTVFSTIETTDRFLVTCTNCAFTNQSSGEDTESRSFRIKTPDGQLQFTDLNQSIEVILKFSNQNKKSSPHLLMKGVYISKVDFTKFVGDLRESTIIQDGIVYFDDLDSKSLSIKEDDFLVAEKLNNFQIKKIYLQEGLGVSLQGEIGELKSGTQSFLYSRMPSYLEKFYANQTLGFFIATIISFFSVIMAIFSLWKIIKEM